MVESAGADIENKYLILLKKIRTGNRKYFLFIVIENNQFMTHPKVSFQRYLKNGNKVRFW